MGNIKLNFKKIDQSLMGSNIDKKAKKILFKRYWKSTGWVDIDERYTESGDFEYAKSKGLMFDPIILDYQEFKSECEKLISSFPIKKATSAFLSSLTNKRPDWRSAIASYANLVTLLEYGDEYFYDIDEDDDINVLNFERIKWGGVRHGKALYNYLDLKILQTEIITEPTKEDIDIFKNILLTIENSNPNDTASMLRENLKNVWNVSKNERGKLLEILGCCKILETLDYDRKEPHRHDWRFVSLWRGEDKYNKQNLLTYFGEYI